MPVFEGENPDGWIYRSERFFSLNRMSESEKLEIGGHQPRWRGPSVVPMAGQSARDPNLGGAQDHGYGAFSTNLGGYDL